MLQQDGRAALLLLLLAFALLGVSANNNTVTLSSYGAQPNNASFDNAVAFQKAASFANSHPGTTILYDSPGATYYATTSANFNKAVNVTIQGNGATIINTKFAGFFYFASCNSIQLLNLTLDMDPLPSIGGLVVGQDKASYTYFDMYVVAPYNINQAIGKPPQAYIQYDPVGGHYARGLDVYQETIASTVTLAPSIYGPPYDGNTIRIPMQYNTAYYLPPVNSSVVVRLSVYGASAIYFGNSQNALVQGVTIYNSPGFGFLGSVSTNITLDHANILKRPDGLWMTTTADGSHFADCRGEVQLLDSRFEGMGDDGTNIHTHNMYVWDIPIPNTIRVCTFQNGKVFTPQQPYTIFPGDVFEFGHLSTPFSPFASAVVASVAQNVTPFYDVTFEGGLPAGVLVSDIVVQATMATALLRNFTVCCNRARGILIKNRGTLIDNCQFLNNSGECIQITTDCGYWWEGSPTRDITVRNSLLDGCNFGTGSTPAALMIFVESAFPNQTVSQPAGTHRNIILQGNRIANLPVGGGIYIGSALNVTVENNYIATTADKPLIYCNSKQVAVDNNLLSPSFNYSRYDTRSGCALALSEVVEGVNGGCPGLYAEYFNNGDLSGDPVISLRNPQINFNWGGNSPASGVSSGSPWSASWEGEITILTNWTITSLTVTASDGIRVWIDGTEVINSWSDQPATTITATLNPPLLMNSTHVITVNYYHNSNSPQASLSWNSEIIPSEAFTNSYCSLPLVTFSSAASLTSWVPFLLDIFGLW